MNEVRTSNLQSHCNEMLTRRYGENVKLSGCGASYAIRVRTRNKWHTSPRLPKLELAVWRSRLKCAEVEAEIIRMLK